jgi:hypothetical protein
VLVEEWVVIAVGASQGASLYVVADPGVCTGGFRLTVGALDIKR